MDLVRLLSLLQTRSLNFARVDTFEDPFEGSLPILNYMGQEQQIKRYFAKGRRDTPQEHWGEMGTAEALLDNLQDTTRRARECTYINCWHAGDTESLAMWKLYGTPTGSVAIQTTYSKLVEALPPQLRLPESIVDGKSWSTDVYVGMVRYIDYRGSVDYLPGGNLLYPFVHKRKELAHEKEVRAFAFFGEGLTISLADRTRLLDRISMPHGLRARVDIEQLVETIRVQPATPDWARDAIENLIRRYGWDMKLTPSEIDTEPLY